MKKTKTNSLIDYIYKYALNLFPNKYTFKTKSKV